MYKERSNCGDVSSAALIKSADFAETVGMEGVYVAKCYDKDGNLKWEDTIGNLVVGAGKQLMLDTLLSGSAYTATVRMGLVSGASSPTYVASDTQAAHAGWSESGLANAPTYSGNRPSITFSSAASSISLASASCTGTTLTTTGSPALTTSMTIIAANGTSLGLITGGSGNTWTVSIGGTYTSQTMAAWLNTAGANVTTKAGTSAVSFTFTGSGTVAGCFININGSATKDDTTGTLYSAGSFTGGNKTVASTDVLNVTYSTTATS